MSEHVYGRIDPAKTSVDEVHQHISEEAARIANGDERMDHRFMWVANPDGTSLVGIKGLVIEWDPGNYHLLFPRAERAEVVAKMNAIGRDAVLKAIYANQEMFVGVILGEARAGRDYFDLYKT